MDVTVPEHNICFFTIKNYRKKNAASPQGIDKIMFMPLNSFFAKCVQFLEYIRFVVG